MAKKIDLAVGLTHFKAKENASIAITEATSTASAPHKAGEYFYYKGDLVIATADIAQVGTITLNTNCKKQPLADSVCELKTAFDNSLCPISFAPTLYKGAYFKVADGGAASNNKYARTYYINNGFPEKAAIVLNSSTYEFCVACYDSTGTVSGTGYIRSIGYQLGGIIHLPPDAAKIGVSFRRQDQAVLADADITAISAALSALAYTDKSLTLANKAADAKATGDAIAEVSAAIPTVDNTLSVSEDAADAKVTGDKIAELTTKSDYTIGNVFTQPYTPSNITVNSSNQIYLETGYISSTTGASGSSSSGKYYRTQVGNSNSRPMLEIGSYPVLAVLGLDWVEWLCWSYSSNTFASATHSNTDEKYINGVNNIYIPYNSTDKRFVIAFRKTGASDDDRTAFTEEELSTLKNAIKFYNVSHTPSTSVVWFGDSITRGRRGDASSLTDTPIPYIVSRELNIVCENFGIGDIGWCAGYSSERTNWTNLIGYLKRVGNPSYYDAADPYNGYKFRGTGDWSKFNTIVLAIGTNDTGYPLGSLTDIDDTLSYAEVMAWKTSAADSDTGGNRTIVKAMYQVYRYIRESEDYHSEGEPYVPNGKHMNIIICDPLITGNTETGTPPLWGYPTQRSGGYTRLELNQLYADFCEKYGLGHISNYDAPIDRVHLANSLPDGVHPNTTTYVHLGRHFAGKISALTI